ncbi:lysosomal proton-coupled steroid conjugate and bile acid symporter SLC46A3-like [Rhopilema esculentum]|uniref:lysosomal proton-coupled steroid conjugate and bile acid symporter SLC46A3-like n=1 Tax=Rhopilema esculentum TaxID=499914 RepID=UPI0031DD2D82
MQVPSEFDKVMDEAETEPKTNEGIKGILKAVFTAPELPFFMYVFGMMLHMPLLQQYAYMRFSQEENFPYHYSAAHSTCGNHQLNKTMKALQEKVQAKSAYFQIGLTLCNTIPSLIVCLYLGAWSDNVGRKPVIILATLCSFVETIFVLLTIMFDLPILVVYIGSFLNGMGGYYTSLTFAVMAYIADSTPADKRALRLGIMEALVFIGATASYFASGHFISQYFFKIPSVLLVVCLGVACLLAIFAMQESIKNKAVRTAGCSTVACLKYPLQVWHTLSKPRPGKWKIIVFMPATIILNMLSIGISPLLMLYTMNSPFCLSPIEVGYFIGTRFFLMGIGTALGIKSLGLLMQPHIVSLIGIISYIAYYTLLAFAQDKKTIYIACLAGVLSGTAGPIFRSILSRTVSQTEQGALFSAVSSLEMLFVFLGNFAFGAVYPVLNNLGHPGAIFILFDCLLLLPFLLNLIYIKRRKNDESQEDLEEIFKVKEVAGYYGTGGSSPPQSPKDR